MLINYSDKPVEKNIRSMFLAGPTPRNIDVKSWRPDAIQILKNLEFDGLIYVPERENDNRTFNYDNQVEWEYEALHSASIIVFWIPREITKMPAFTTNVEFGYYFGQYPDKVVYGRPDNASKIQYLDWLYTRDKKRTIHDNLEDTLKDAVEKLKEIH